MCWPNMNYVCHSPTITKHLLSDAPSGKSPSPYELASLPPTAPAEAEDRGIHRCRHTSKMSTYYLKEDISCYRKLLKCTKFIARFHTHPYLILQLLLRVSVKLLSLIHQ